MIQHLADAEGNISPDWRFGIASHAAFELCTILNYVAGYCWLFSGAGETLM